MGQVKHPGPKTNSTALIPFWRLSPSSEIISKIVDISISIIGDYLSFWRLKKIFIQWGQTELEGGQYF